ncbi:MAG: glycosyltransferase, partial [Candidatus Paceibacterales bacterium]
MPRVTIVQVLYNHRRFIEPVFSAIFAQTFKDFNVVAVISGNDDGGKELLMEKFPRVEIIDPGYNIGFAAGHNLVFSKYDSEFFQLVNPDMLMESNYVEE